MGKGKKNNGKKQSHRDCLNSLCFCCLSKKNEVRPIKESESDFICAGPYPDFQTNSDYLPSRLCTTCRLKIKKFMSVERNVPVEFTSCASPDKYDSIVNELKLLPYESLDCSCSVCKIIRSGYPSWVNNFCKVDASSIPSDSTTIDDSNNPTNLSEEPSAGKSEPVGTSEPVSTSEPVGTSEPTGSSEPAGTSRSDSVVQVCLKCWTIVGVGISHTCNRITRLKNLNAHLSPSTQQQMAAQTIKAANSKQVYLKTLGQPLFVSLEAVQNVQTGHDFFLGIQTDNPSISNKTLINIAARYRRFHGGNSVEPHFVSALIESGDICKDFFDWKQFVFEEKVDEETVEVNKPVVFCNDVASFVDFVKVMRDIKDKDYVTKIGLDGGGGSIKVTLALVERPSYDDPQPPKKKVKLSDQPIDNSPPSPLPKSTVEDPDFCAPRAPRKRNVSSDNSAGGSANPGTSGIRVPIDSKKPRYLETGVKRMFIIASAPGVKETYDNVQKILDALKIFDIHNEGITYMNLGSEDSLHTDLKDWNHLLGLMSHSSSYPCSWCESKKGVWEKNAPRRTLGRIRMLAKEYKDAMEKWERMKARGVKCWKKPEAKDYFCCVRDPLLGGNDNKSIYDVCPLPELHLLTGITNHIFCKLNEKWGEDGENKAFDWAEEKFFIKSDAHNGLGFKGPNSREILKKAKDLANDLPRNLTMFAYALDTFNTVVEGSFGKVESPTILLDIVAFEKAFMKLGISVTPKVHAVFEHLPEFLSLGYGPLGFYSEQATEACHYDFIPIWNNYRSNSLKPEQVGKQHHRAILKYNGLHLRYI